MIKLKKFDETHPEHGPLIAALALRRSTHDEAISQGRHVTDSLKGSYRAVKPAVCSEANEKCAYCESKVNDVYVGDVEHILPKATDPTRTLDYSNLTYVCWRCNNAKSDVEFTDGLPLLNPYNDNGPDFLRFCGLVLRPVKREPDFVRAQRTIDTMKLNRQGLVDRRLQSWEKFELLEAAYYRSRHPAVKESVLKQILEVQKSGNEDSMFASFFFRSAGLPEAVSSPA